MRINKSEKDSFFASFLPEVESWGKEEKTDIGNEKVKEIEVKKEEPKSTINPFEAFKQQKYQEGVIHFYDLIHYASLKSFIF